MQVLKNVWAIMELNLDSHPDKGERERVTRCIRSLEMHLPHERLMLLISCDDLSLAADFVSAVPSSNILIQTRQERRSAVPLLPLLLEIEKKDREARILYISSEEVGDTSAIDRMIEEISEPVSLNDPSRVLLWASTPSFWNADIKKTWIVPEHGDFAQGYPVARIQRSNTALCAVEAMQEGGLCATGSFTASISTLLLLYMLTSPGLVQSYLEHYDQESFVFWGDGKSDSSSQDLLVDLLGENLAFLRVKPFAALPPALRSVPAQRKKSVAREVPFIWGPESQELPARRFMH